MSTGADDLLVVGAGVLGQLVATEWQTLHPHATVTGETRTDTKHADLKQKGIQPALAGSLTDVPNYMVFSAPPSGSQDYAATVAATVARASPATRIVFTSSGSVHGDASKVSEDTPVHDQGRSATLAAAEQAVLAHPNSAVIRLSGLYTRERGAHSYWLRIGEVTSAPNGNVNLIHYGDAAHAVVLALKLSSVELSKLERRTFLAAARERITRKGICEAALKHPLFKESSMPAFPNDEHTPRERIYDNELTRKILGWTPRWESFAHFMREDAEQHK